jgi:hypothetical protein
MKQDPDNHADEDHSTVVIPWIKPPSKRARSILRPTSVKDPLRPMKLERRATLAQRLPAADVGLMNSSRTRRQMPKQSQSASDAACDTSI